MLLTLLLWEGMNFWNIYQEIVLAKFVSTNLILLIFWRGQKSNKVNIVTMKM